MKNFKAETIVAKCALALTGRKAALVEQNRPIAAEIKTMLDRFSPEGRSHKSFLHAVENTKSVFDFEPLMKMVRKETKATGIDCDYMQCKSLLKVVQFVEGFGNKNFRSLDGYTRTILLNAIANAGSLKAKTAFVALTSIGSDDDIEQRIVQRKSHTSGTADTQISSTKELFRALGLTENVKGIRDAEIVIKPEALTALIEHFEALA